MPFTSEYLEKLLVQALPLVVQAGEIILEQSCGPLRINYKGPTNLVTQTDWAVEDFLRQALGRLTPDIAFLGEEETEAAFTVEPAVNLGEPLWVVDPVDGTVNYAHGLPFVATSAGLWDGQGMALGIINCPFLGECYFAVRGAGAYLGLLRQGRGKISPKPGGQLGESSQSRFSKMFADLFTAVSRLQVSEACNLQETLLATGFPYEPAPNLELIMRRLALALPATRGLRRCGAAAIDMAYVAAGHFDAYYEEWIKPWDVAAGWLLVEEAGGKVGDLQGELRRLCSPGIIAAAPNIFTQLTRLLRQAE